MLICPKCSILVERPFYTISATRFTILMEYVLYCDESSDKGPLFVDFFGGCLVDGRYIDEISANLNSKKEELGLLGEIKWTKVTEQYLDKYIAMIDLFFEYVRAGKIRIRIMFRKKDSIPTLLNRADDKYFKLYYQFIKHAFGFKDIPSDTPTRIRIYLDQLPDKKERCDNFKEFLFHMQTLPLFENSGLIIKKEDIAEIDSGEHVIQQCLDIVLGSMYFRLNKLNKVTSPDTHHRGKRTIAKEKLYNHINQQIQQIHPNFNIGVSTGAHGYDFPHLQSPYEHWLFKSYEMKSEHSY